MRPIPCAAVLLLAQPLCAESHQARAEAPPRPAAARAAPAQPAPAPPTRAESIVAAGARFDLITIDPRRAALRLYWRDAEGRPFGDFAALQAHLRARGEELVVATNAGIYEPGQIPTGVHIERGRVLQPLNLREGAGNFYLRPSGVFYLDGAGPHIVESSRFPRARGVREATQSGPLLLDEGRPHPAMLPDSPHRKLRNAVGVTASGEVLLILSREEVSFYQVTEALRGRGCRSALYLDGSISGLFAPQLPDAPPGRGPFAGILAVSRPAR